MQKARCTGCCHLSFGDCQDWIFISLAPCSHFQPAHRCFLGRPEGYWQGEAPPLREPGPQLKFCSGDSFQVNRFCCKRTRSTCGVLMYGPELSPLLIPTSKRGAESCVDTMLGVNSQVSAALLLFREITCAPEIPGTWICSGHKRMDCVP